MCFLRCSQAMHEQIDSFAAFPYADGGVGRISNTTTSREVGIACVMGCAAAPWTGSLVLKQSSIAYCLDCDDGSTPDMNAPPDIFSTLTDGLNRGASNLQEVLKPMKRLFVCGLALDFCVLDTSAAAHNSTPALLQLRLPSHLLLFSLFGCPHLRPRHKRTSHLPSC